MDTLRLDINEIAVGDIEDFQAYTGHGIDVLDELDTPGVMPDPKVLVGFALLVLRQTDPEATIVEARRVKIGQIQSISVADPTPAAKGNLTPLNKPTRSPKRSTA